MDFVKKYGIKSKVQNEGAAAINLGRIAAAFPLITAKILSAIPDKYMDRPFPHKKIIAKVANYPKILMCNAIASLIPESAIYTDTVNLCIHCT